MKALKGLILSIPVLGVLLWLGLVATMIVGWFYGIYLAFSASILLGIIVFLVEPSPLVIGLVMLFFHKNLAQMIIDFLNQ